MAKQVKNAQEPADGEPEALGPDQPQAGGEPETAPLVEDDGAGSAAAGKAGSSDLPDEAAGDADGGQQAGIPEGADGAAQEAPAELSGLGQAGDAGPAGDQDPVGISEPDGGGVDGDAGTVALDPDGNPASDQAPAHDADGSADGGDGAGETLGRFDQLERLDRLVAMSVASAGCAVFAVTGDEDEAQDFMDRFFAFDVVVAAAELIRKIGDRATVPVIAQELMLRKLRQTAELNGLQGLALATFASTLRVVDGFQKTLVEIALKAEAERNRPPPHHTPVEETTLATGTSPFDKVF